MIFALAFIPAVIVAGAAVDYGRAIREKGELAAATDGAALSVGKLMRSKTSAELVQAANQFLSASNPRFTLVGEPVLNADKTEVCIATNSDLPATLMRVANVMVVPVGAESCAKLGGTTYEIALALDVTGSMNSGGKIGSLKTAAKNFIDTVLPANGSQNNYVNISIVPFSTSVRAFDPDTIAAGGNSDEATRFNNISWLDTRGNSSIHWENYPKVSGGSFDPASRFELFANMNQRWGGCFEARPGIYALTDAPANGAAPDSLFVPMLAPDEGDAARSTFNNYLDDNDNSICRNGDPYFVRDRQSPYFRDGQSMLCKYKPASGRTLVLDLSGGKGPNRNCQTQSVMQLTNSNTSLKAKIDSLVAGGNTNIIEGLMWGWRTVSPNGPYTGAQPYTKPNHKKVLVLMTDGENTWGTNSNNPNISDYSPFGYFWNKRLGTAAGIGDVAQGNVQDYMDAKAREACANARAAGVEIHTVGFAQTGYPISAKGIALLKACATSESHYHLVTNGSELDLAFQNIGASLDGLHLSR